MPVRCSKKNARQGIRNRYVLLCAFITALVLMGGYSPLSAGNEAVVQKKRVLILHSFHKGQPWNDNLSEGIEGVLQGLQAEVNFEYMDSKRHTGEDQLTHFFLFLRQKYHRRPVDVVISTDQPALDFLLLNGKDLFPEAAIIFCGIKYFDRYVLFGEPNITGVVEPVDIRSNFQLAMQLNPDLEKMLVLTDNSPTSLSTIKSFGPVLHEFNSSLTIRFVELLDYETLVNEIEKLPENSAVLLVNYTKDTRHRVLSMEESARMVTDASPVPVYALWDSYLGNGIIGGRLVSGYVQGKKAAEIALRILDGERPEDIPIVNGSTGQFMFDHQVLTRFGIRESRLPEKSTIINRPHSFYEQYRRMIFMTIFGGMFLVIVIVVLSMNIARRRRVEKSLKQTSQQNYQLLRKTRKHEAELKRMSGHILEAQEKERQRISAELHDEFGQTLTAIGLNLTSIHRKTEQIEDDKLRYRIEETEDYIEQLSGQIHDLSLDLRPPMINDLGLSPTLRWYLNHYQERTGLSVEFSALDSQAGKIPEDIAVAFYRVLQEALTNVTKYAKASKLTVHLEMAMEELKLFITDNGVGFDMEAVLFQDSMSQGIGLVGMRERLDLLGGTLRIRSAEGDGTTIQATVPIRKESLNG